MRPTIPHNAAGWRIEPPVSVPMAHGALPAATAAALPPDEPRPCLPREVALAQAPDVADDGFRVPSPTA